MALCKPRRALKPDRRATRCRIPNRMQNPGCGATFDLRITPQNASLLSGMMACPRCRRHGGMLKPQGRLADKLLAAKLLYRATGVAPTLADEDEPAVRRGSTLLSGCPSSCIPALRR
jgi:hypothetical protein